MIKNFQQINQLYIYKLSHNNTRYYVGSTIKLATRLSSHRSSVISWSKGNYKNGSPKIYNSVLKYGWNTFKFGIIEHINFSITYIKKTKISYIKKRTILFK